MTNTESACSALQHDPPVDVIVIGSGAAGLAAALALRPRQVALMTKTAAPGGGSTLYAQGGIAAAVGGDDSPALHAADTIAAGAGACVEEAVRMLTAAAPEAIAWLESQGMAFDRGPDGGFALAREAAHNRRRVLHAGGDATGAAVSRALAAAASRARHIDIRAGRFAWDLATDANGRIAGVVTHDADTGWRLVTAAQVILATGGCGQVYSQTSNPPEATGDGIAMAGRAGATLADMAFVQFHPTALAVSGARQLPLLTEALRGEGARLVNAAGEPIMAGEHPAGELAPRDVVARAVWRRRAAGEAVFLDARKIDRVADRFPTITALCAEHGLDPRRDLLPVAPAAHYLMGGVATDLDGRTDLPGLWAVGEAARTGVHGANRLASNSLLECVVFALRVAHAIPAGDAPGAAPIAPALPSIGDAAKLPIDAMRQLMYARLGLARDAAGIAEAAAELDRLDEAMAASRPLDRPDHAMIRAWGEARNLLTVAHAIARDAAARPHSIGAHNRSDATISG